MIQNRKLIFLYDTKENTYLVLYITVIGTFRVKFTLCILDLFYSKQIKLLFKMKLTRVQQIHNNSRFIDISWQIHCFPFIILRCIPKYPNRTRQNDQPKQIRNRREERKYVIFANQFCVQKQKPQSR